LEVATVEPDAALVQRAANGDRGAFDALARKYRPWLIGLCFRLLGDREATEDSVQEALARAFTGIGKLREPARFRAWLGRIALNACRMHMRRIASVPVHEVIAESAPGPEANTERTLTEVDDALTQIDRATRRLLMLFYDEGLTHTELAETLSLSPSAVKSRLHRARGRLRKEMLETMSPEQKARLGVTEQEPWVLRTVLLVEPDESLQASIREGLDAAGYEVLTLPSGEAALAAAAARRGQMLILDKHCGEPHWLEVLTLLKTDAWTRENVPVAVLVDPDNERDVFLAWGVDAAVCLTRPPIIRELVGFVKKLERRWPEELRPEPWPKD
jgi:RNA polymerase sigma-70 factor (ECF subfamily)